MNAALKWAGRVSRRKIKQLYESDAQGMLDAELVDDVGFGFYSRLVDMFEIDEASQGRVKCRKCGSMILRRKGTRASNGRLYRGRDEALKCAQCDWKITWGEYFDSYSGKSLQPNSAINAFKKFKSRWPTLKTAKDKMLLIDWLVHQFHLQYRDRIPLKPAAVNLIEGTPEQIIVLLNELAYSADSFAELKVKDDWKEQLNDEYRLIITRVGATKILKLGKELGVTDYRKMPIKSLIDRIQELDATLLE
ncbi:MAG: hypothetical protein JXB30_17090 [Anaerolineae bacterium]|nr:hypothetical protein [Anaerolineae bacterium]